MIVFPNAKINIGLNITERRHDGYHNLETIFYPIHQCQDALEIIHSEHDEFVLKGNAIPGDDNDNLILKALKLLRNYYVEARKPVRIILLKNIPMGAGLGGGSADAGFALRLFNEFFELNISQEKLLEYALKLGSDVPFFIINTPAKGSGRGELLEKIELDLNKYDIRLVHHNVHISTADAFKGIVPKASTFNLSKILHIPINEWRQYVFNDFEKTIFPIYPELDESKNKLYSQGALYASLTGTGATVYGIFPKENF